ncbi:MAG: peptidylprolyl isomerase FKBP-type [Segetibacter sp.]|nr:peptidylprolyl isomerase FKBP-type [Segetibacter sp.]
MKNFILLACVVMIAFTGCFKEDKACTAVKPSDEQAAILAYANANGINATKHSSGLYYEILNPGSGATPTLNSMLYVNYVGKFLSGTTFDQTTGQPANFSLRGVIEGWQIGLPLIKKGGRIKLIIPSAYAYSCVGNGGIPPNSILFFDIDLVDVQ